MKPSSTFASLLDRSNLRRMAGAASFERGEDYFANDQVKRLSEEDGVIAAKVQGTYPYRVKLWLDGQDLDYSCTCPVGADGEFCKHCVAVGLAWLEGSRRNLPSGKAEKPAVVTKDDVRAYLKGQDKDALVDMLVEHAARDERLGQRLFLKTAKNTAKGINLASYRRAIDEAVESDGFVRYRDAYSYTQGIDEVIDSIEELLKEGNPAAVIDLAEYALVAVESAMGSIDDSAGHMGSILERLQELHLKACKKAKPDPESLARRLFGWELRTDYDTFYGAAETYGGILGEKGLAVYRQLAEAEWAKVPALRPGFDDREKYGNGFASRTSWKRWRVGLVMSKRWLRLSSATCPWPTNISVSPRPINALVSTIRPWNGRSEESKLSPSGRIHACVSSWRTSITGANAMTRRWHWSGPSTPNRRC
jgi:hypothetical protein